MKCDQVYETVEGYIGGAYAKYGRFVSRHAWKILIITIIVNGALGIGMLNIESNIDVNDVYLPLGTQARKDRVRIENIFPDMSDTHFNRLQMTSIGISAGLVVKSKNGNLLTRASLEEIKQLSESLQSVTARDSNDNRVTFPDICAKTKTVCAVEGSILWDSDFLTAVDNGTVTYPDFTFASSGTLNYASFIGETVHVDSTGSYLTGMEYLKLEFMIQTKYRPEAIVWAKEFTSKCESFIGNNVEIAYGHFNSLSEEIDTMLLSDITLISATFALMITYACIATLSARLTDQVGQRMWLGFGGLLATGLAIVSSFGLCAASGVSFVSIVGLMPFLMIGIGIDDMFILLSGLSEAQTKLSVEDKIAETMRVSGVGITITSLTDLIAFLAGVGSSFVAVRNFCIYTGVAVIFCFINNITLFAACLTINERRVAENRHYMTCKRIKTKQELKSEGHHSKCHVLCCGGRPPMNRNEAESVLDKFPRWLIPKLVLKFPCKIFIVILFCVYLAGAIYGCVYLKQGLLLTQLVGDDSYFYEYADWLDKHFKEQVPITFVVPRTYDYSQTDNQAKITNLITTAQSNEYFDATFEVNWLKSYISSTFYAPSSEAEFIDGLLNFLGDPNYAMFKNDVIIDTENTKITASRVYVLSKDMKSSQESGEIMLKSRDIADQASIVCFAYCPLFFVYEQYVRILGQTLQSVGIALVAVFVVTCIFMPHPVLVLFCVVAVTMIMAGVFGYMYFVDIALSAITMIHLIMSIGFSVDFTAHICHGYMLSRGKSRNDRVHEAIDKTGAPIFHGAVSSILGILVIVRASSYVFRAFAAVMSFVLLFGIAHALLLLPVVLSWIGPGRVSSVRENSKQTRDSNILSKNSKNNGEMYLNNSHTNQAFGGSNTRLHYDLPLRQYNNTNTSLKDVVNFKQNVRPYRVNHSTGLDDQWIWTEIQ